MSENSKIEWTDHTFNPWIGCTKVHEGCKHCYAETMMDSRYGKAKWGPQGTRVMTSDANWRKPIQWNRKAEIQFNSWERMHKDLPGGEQELLQRGFVKPTRPRVFCASLADVFEDWGGSIRVSSRLPVLTNGEHFVGTDGPEIDEWRLATIHDLRKRLFTLIDSTPCLDWQLLTKRPENIRLMWPDDRRRHNVWLGTSVSTQEHADKQIPELLKCQDLAANLFLSIEPMIGAIDISKWLLDGITWVIVGGESGHGARPVHPEWVRSIRDQCVEAGVPFFFKQWGEWVQLPEFHYSPRIGSGNKEYCRALSKFKTEHGAMQLIDSRPEGWHGNLDAYGAIMDGERPIGRVGKKAASNIIDGVEWNQLPASLKDVP